MFAPALVHLCCGLHAPVPQALASGNAFCINQLGLSFFTHDHVTNSYSAKTFNLYLFPAPFEQYDRRFLSQASSIAFLAQQGFDFNKFIHDGIPYMPLQLRDVMLRRVCGCDCGG